jgi:hypothetical protein
MAVISTRRETGSPGAPEPFLDLSTGINPPSVPLVRKGDA